MATVLTGLATVARSGRHTGEDGSSAAVTVAEVLVEFLGRAGVRQVFGVAGSTIMPILDAIRSAGQVSYVGARYELSAAEMASGFARASARLGVAMTHVGPGVSSCLTALANAVRDGIPLLLITGNEESHTLVRAPYHDWDLMGVMRSVTGFSYRITQPDELPHALRRALGEAARGVTGPVHLDLPEDIALRLVAAEQVARWHAELGPVLDAVAKAPELPISRPRPSADEVDRAVELLAGARAPVVVVGEAARRRSSLVRLGELCAELGIPYASTLGARGGRWPRLRGHDWAVRVAGDDSLGGSRGRSPRTGHRPHERGHHGLAGAWS